MLSDQKVAHRVDIILAQPHDTGLPTAVPGSGYMSASEQVIDLTNDSESVSDHSHTQASEGNAVSILNTVSF